MPRPDFPARGPGACAYVRGLALGLNSRVSSGRPARSSRVSLPGPPFSTAVHSTTMIAPWLLERPAWSGDALAPPRSWDKILAPMEQAKPRLTTGRLLRGMVRAWPEVWKNFRLYFRNLYSRNVLGTNVVAPYAAVLYATHKCNLACSYCTQKEPDVFSDELSTQETIRLLGIIRRETDSIVFTGGEPTLRADIEDLLHAARHRLGFRSVLMVTNGTLLDRRVPVFDSLTGLVISLDALQPDPTNPLSKPAALPKVLENITLAKSRLGDPRRITISTVIEEWNISEIERILDWCGEQGFFFTAQAALHMEVAQEVGADHGGRIGPGDVEDRRGTH